MAGGQVEFRLPDGWEIISALEDITDEKIDATATPTE